MCGSFYIELTYFVAIVVITGIRQCRVELQDMGFLDHIRLLLRS